MYQEFCGRENKAFDELDQHIVKGTYVETKTMTIEKTKTRQINIPNVNVN
jgi:hypothetical protein